ncbi:ATP-binding protein [Agaribacterium haliotis]|uniref:ATP-binding protein n=1 Tax=Agaribacterium haliotis TaxID=2013869 RepID=UPI000BB5941B|nr:ATP-binding protein [Agaribacterium haliotis]
MWSALGKYRAIVVSIALFLFLDASVLTLNFYISFKIADDAVGVNLAGRQRMLTQRTVKSLYAIDNASVKSEAEATAINELEMSYQLFSSTLTAFEQGGYTTGAAGEQVELKAVSSPKAIKAIAEAKELWQPLSKEIQQILQADSEQQLYSALGPAISYANANNLKLLSLMNSLTVELESIATSQAQTLRYIQTGGISLAIVNFLFILFHFLGELRTNDRKLEAARQETTEILNTVSEGLFLLDEDLRLGNQHSGQLSEMFGGKEVSGISFSELIGDLVKSKDLETAERFVGLLFRPNVKDNLIKDLNPLTEVELNIPDKEGGYSTRYLSFDFSRVAGEENKNTVLVTVTDVTRSVELARELAEEKERSEQQMETLTSILHTEPKTLKRFIQDAFDSFSKINEVLKDQGRTDSSMSRKLNEIFVEVHNFKGDASALELDNFADLANRFEDDIQQTLTKNKVGGNDFLKLAVHLENLIRYTESVQEIAEKLASFSVMSSDNKNTPKNHSDSSRWQHLTKLCYNVAEREQKQAQLVITGFNEADLDEATESLINDVCIQFIRNALVHSIEKPELREARNKNACGRIDARLCTMPSGEIELSIHDDGAGINYDKIRDKAAASGQWDQNSLANWSNKKLLGLIFEPGFSTADKLSNDAGRGVGMDVIRSRVQAHNGRLKISSRSGIDCQFTITLPPQKQASAAA